MRRSTPRSFSAPVALAALLLGLSGCFNPFSPKVAQTLGVSEVAPTPNTPRGVTDLFAWCWNNRAYDEYTEVFTEDFEFQFALTDSAGNAFRDRALYRQDELDTARHLFIEGTANEPPATKISLVFDRSFLAGVDSRPGKTFPVHQEVKRNVVLSIETEAQQFRITGAARFFVVRGDSALIPDELVQRGFGPDPNRWYIERWEDETLDSGAGLVANLPQEQLRAALMEALASEARDSGAPAVSEGASAAATGATTATRDCTWGYIKARFATPQFSAQR